jgi:Curli production assembly/transport component CsgG
VLDRSQTQVLEAEQDNKLNERFDPSQAVKLGKLQGVDTIIFVRVESFDVSAPEKNVDKFLYNEVTVDGIVHLNVSAKAIAVDTGSVLIAPAASIEKNEIIRKYKELTDRQHPVAPTRDQQESNASIKRAALVKLLDTAIDESSKDLTTKLTAALTATTARPVAPAKVVGIDAGKVMINRGSSNGFKVGDKFQVIRMADSGFKDPDSGQPIIRKKIGVSGRF